MAVASCLGAAACLAGLADVPGFGVCLEAAAGLASAFGFGFAAVAAAGLASLASGMAVNGAGSVVLAMIGVS